MDGLVCVGLFFFVIGLWLLFFYEPPECGPSWFGWYYMRR